MDEATRITLNTLWYALLAALLMPLPDEVRRSLRGSLATLARTLDRPCPPLSEPRRHNRSDVLG